MGLVAKGVRARQREPERFAKQRGCGKASSFDGDRVDQKVEIPFLEPVDNIVGGPFAQIQSEVGVPLVEIEEYLG